MTDISFVTDMIQYR